MFYRAYAHFLKGGGKLALFQQVWVAAPPRNDLFDAAFVDQSKKEIRFVVDAMHGRGDVAPNKGRGGGIYRFPGPIHEGGGEGVLIIDKRADPKQRDALFRILSGEDTEPAATIWSVFSAMVEKMHEPIFANIEFEIDIDARKARARVAGVAELRGEPILNAVTGAEHRVRIEQPNGFEFTVAEIGRGWTKLTGPLAIELADSYGQFANIHLCQDGVVR